MVNSDVYITKTSDASDQPVYRIDVALYGKIITM